MPGMTNHRVFHPTTPPIAGPVTANACAHPVDPNTSSFILSPHRRIHRPIRLTIELLQSCSIARNPIRHANPCQTLLSGGIVVPRTHLGCLPAHRIVSRAYPTYTRQRTVDAYSCQAPPLFSATRCFPFLVPVIPRALRWCVGLGLHRVLRKVLTFSTLLKFSSPWILHRIVFQHPLQKERKQSFIRPKLLL